MIGCEFGHAEWNRPIERFISVHQQTYDADAQHVQKLVLKKQVNIRQKYLQWNYEKS